MIKAVAIFLAMLLLSQGIVIRLTDWQKMDALIEHAKFHKEQYGDSLTTFIDKHYGEKKDQHFSEHQEEKNDHEQLPYNHTALLVMHTAFLINPELTHNLAAFITDSQKVNFFYSLSYSSLLVSKILQPPQSS